MAFIGSLITTVKANTDPFKKNLRKAGRATKELRSDLVSLGKSSFKLGLAVAGTASLIGLAAIKLASDFAEADQKFGVVFQSVSEKSANMRDELVRNFGLSKTAATELLSSTGDLLTGFGFTDDAALALSNRVQELSVDLASFNNLQGGAARASEIITKALLGERDSLISLGVKISEADLQQRLLLKGQKELTGTALRAAKAQATYELIIEQTGKAQGDFARSSDSMANLIKTSTARLDDLTTSMGQKLLPIATVAVQKFLALEESTLSWVTANEELIDTKVDEFLEDVLLVMGKTVDMLSLVRAGWNGLSIGVKSAGAALAGLAGQEEIQNELRASAIEDLEEMEKAYSNFENEVAENKSIEVFKKLSNSIKEARKEVDDLTESGIESGEENKTLKEELELRGKAIELEKKQAEEHKKVIAEAQRIFDEVRTPLESVEAEITRILELMTKGLDEGLQEGLQRKLDELRKEREKLKAELDDTITVSTGEGLSEVAEEIGKQVEEMKTPLEEMLKQAEEILAGVESAPDAVSRFGSTKQLDLKNVDIAGLDRSGDIGKKTLDENKKTNVLLQDLIQITGNNTAVGIVAL